MSPGNIQPDVSRATEKRRTAGDTLTQSALAYIELHYKERFSLQTMAGELFVNGSYLLRVFKKHKPKGRGMKMVASPVKEYAISKNIPVLHLWHTTITFVANGQKNY